MEAFAKYELCKQVKIVTLQQLIAAVEMDWQHKQWI